MMAVILLATKCIMRLKQLKSLRPLYILHLVSLVWCVCEQGIMHKQMLTDRAVYSWRMSAAEHKQQPGYEDICFSEETQSAGRLF